MGKPLYITIDGVSRRLVDVAAEKGMPSDLLRRRILLGFTGNKLFAPAHKRYKGDGSYKWTLSKLTAKGR